jgi:hypothetical protein
MFSEISVCIDVAIERDGLDPELGREGSHRRVPVRHGSLALSARSWDFGQVDERCGNTVAMIDS